MEVCFTSLCLFLSFLVSGTETEHVTCTNTANEQSGGRGEVVFVSWVCCGTGIHINTYLYCRYLPSGSLITFIPQQNNVSYSDGRRLLQDDSAPSVAERVVFVQDEND